MKNFRFLDELIHSGEHEIFLDSDIVLEDGEELKYSEGINVDVDFITLNGNAHTIDARGMARIFKVFASGIRFNNIHFKRGFSKSFGGAIHNRGYSQLNIHDSVFESNHACGDGGAIYSECKLFVNNCRFTNNSSSSNGGAIEILPAREVRIHNSSFVSNSSALNGGGVSNEGVLEVYDCIFEKNSSKCGGGLYSDERNFKIIPNTRCARTICYLDEKGCEFRDNSPDDVFEVGDKR